MNRAKIAIDILEPSPMLTRALTAIIDQDGRFSIDGTYHDLAQYQALPEHRQAADIVIVNPSLIDHAKRGQIKRMFGNNRVVALVYHYCSGEMLAQFDETIDIYDSESKIITKLLSLTSQDQVTSADQGELSDREKEILIAVAKGLTNKEIADQHNISIHTVISHRKNISKKTGIRTVSGFVVYALLNNLIEQSDIQ